LGTWFAGAVYLAKHGAIIRPLMASLQHVLMSDWLASLSQSESKTLTDQTVTGCLCDQARRRSWSWRSWQLSWASVR